MKSSRQERTPKHPINENIRALKVQLITADGQNVGVVARSDAMREARNAGLDLVLIAESGSEGVPVTKIMDFGKELYARKKKQAEAKKHQKIIQVKEVKLRPKIGQHDFETKLNQAIQFLKSGKHVKFTLMFRGREMVTKFERGTDLFKRVDDYLEQQGITNLVQEKDAKAGNFWSRICYIKQK